MGAVTWLLKIITGNPLVLVWLLGGSVAFGAVSGGTAAWQVQAWRMDALQGRWDSGKAAQLADALKASEDARAKEQVLQTKVTKVANDYYAEKKRRAADALAGAGRLRDLEAALAGAASANPPTAAGADDPRGAIANQCAGALTTLDEYAKGLAGQTTALQGYARSVCLAK